MLFFESIEAHPADWSALIFKDKETTFGELRQNIDNWAAYLQNKGLQKGERVGLFSKNCPEFVTAYHAIIKAGGVVVPINFMLSPTETAFILKDADVKMLFVQEVMDLTAALEKRDHAGVEQITFEEIANAPEATPATVAMHEDECCSIIYTSGTTGNPKGAMLSHKNIIANIHSFTNAISMEPKDKAFCVLPMHHCFGWTVCVAGPMMKGGAVVIQDNYNVADILRLLVTYKVNQFCGIPTFAQMFLRAAEPEHLASLRWFVTGGAPLPAHLSKAFKEKFGKYPQEGYGLSEAAPVCAVNPGDKIKVGSIGLALP
ncbi:MAG: AMP-binding protein [Phascolarctobacterium sp.]|nr:AMP-binding protein [Phascolarctobacterium sp.]